jgi:Septum formation
MKVLTSKLVLISVVLVVVLLVGCGGGDKAKPKTSGKVGAKDLTVGTCVTDANSYVGDVTTFEAVECTKRHDGEVFTIIALGGAKYPGLTRVNAKGQRGCRARLRRQATAKAFRDRRLGFEFVYPTTRSWAQDDHEITCLVTFKKPRTGKLAQR